MRLRFVFYIAGFGLLAGLLMAQQTPPQTPQTTNRTGPPSASQPSSPTSPTISPAPSIPASDRAEFFKRQVALLQAQQTMTAAQTEFQKAVEELQKDCGERFQPQVGPGGDPVCVPKVEPAKPPTKK